jgi:hypothetical protein
MFEHLRASWEHVNDVSREAFVDCRLEAHWAVQLLGQAGAAWAIPKPDFAHLAVDWDCERRDFVGTELSTGHRLALDPHSLTLDFLAEGGRSVAFVGLVGKTLADGLAWMNTAMASVNPAAAAAVLPTHEMPDHPVGTKGAPFTTPKPDAARYLDAWYSNALAICSAIRESEPLAGPVRVWPHHFDLATLITLDPDADPEAARSIGIGMSPGDAGSEWPYWYVNVWPIPESPDLVGAPGDGRWKIDGWVGAVLPGEAVSGRASEVDQAEQTTRFVAAAHARMRELLGA